MRSMRRTVAVAVIGASLGLGVLGSAALAAFAPAPDPATSGELTVAPKGGDRIKAVLEALVARGVITRAQADAILAALAEEQPRPDGDIAKRIYAGLLTQSAAYLGMDMAELKAKLPGTTLAAIANATPGKSADGLVRHLVDAVNTAVDRAVAEGKLTAEQGARIKAGATEHVTRFVQHTYPERDARPRHPKIAAFLGDVIAASREYLGISREDLVSALRSGKSLGEIASATPGKSRDGLIAAITASVNAKIDAAQQAGKLTAEQAAQLRTAVGTAVTQIVDRRGGHR